MRSISVSFALVLISSTLGAQAQGKFPPDSLINTMSHNSATLHPSPTAGPFTAAITGSGNAIISVTMRLASAMTS